jgi:nitrogen fixation NifU-like protein
MDEAMCVPSHNHESKDMSQSFNSHASNQSYCGALPSPDGYAHAKGTCGDSLEMFVYISEDKINTATFLAHGCRYTHACASAMTSLILGRGLNEAFELEEDHIEDVLNGLPREHRHCANLAVRTFRQAITAYHARCRAAWKRVY